MKAITLWQPWATAMAMGVKTIETRGWFTRYRGDLLICAAKRTPLSWERDILTNVLAELLPRSNPHVPLPLGVALCIVELYDCVPTHAVQGLKPQERALGDFTDGRHAWLTRNLRTLPRVFPCVGRQGLFEACVQATV